jgi:type 1 glutamine amidotransferase
VLLSIDTPKMKWAPSPHSQAAPAGHGLPDQLGQPYGKGRVFASTMGHAPEVFQNAAVLAFLAGIQFAWAT